MSIPEGYGLIAGRSRKNAQAALAAAEAAGVDSTDVVATNEGYVVPEAVLEAYSAAAGIEYPEPEPEDDAAIYDVPDDGWKNADIKAWAEDHQVDLDGATTKADMLAAIADAGTA